MDHRHEPLPPANEPAGAKNFWELVDQICDRHGISIVHEYAEPGTGPVPEIIP